MHRSVGLLNANIQTAVKSKVFSAMEYSAGRVLREVVFYVRRCGICFKYIPALAKNQNAVYHGAGTFDDSICSILLDHLGDVVCRWYHGKIDLVFSILQGSEGTLEKIAAAI